jgi:AcrR family transcriptional regulator
VAQGCPEQDEIGHPHGPRRQEILDSQIKNEYSFSMPKLSRDTLDARRAHILRAAEVCFARDGYHHTTIADVRREADVSTGAIYTYFESKEEMMRAILERARDERKQQLTSSTSDAGTSVDPAVVLLRWASEIFSPRGQHAARVDVNLWAEALRSPRIRALARGALREATSAVSEVVAARLPASGQARSVDPDSVAFVLIALFLGIEVQSAVGMAIDPGEVVRVLGVLFADHLPPAAGQRAQRSAQRTRRRGRVRAPRSEGGA